MILGIFDRLFKKKSKPEQEEEFEPPMEIDMPYEMEDMDSVGGQEFPQFLDVPMDLEMDSKIIYNFDKLEYRLKVHNKTSDILGDIGAILRTEKKSVVDVIKSKNTIEMLEPGKSIVMKFKLKPKFKLGKSGIYGKIEYFDFKSKERKILRLPQAYVEFDYSGLNANRIDDDKWRLICSGLKNYEVETTVLEIPPDEVFGTFKKVLTGLGLFMLPPIENVNLYRGIAKFYGYDNEENQYALEVQVIGDNTKSKVLFRIWSSEPQTAMALAFKTLDIVNGAIKIKEFIVET